jgi:hypothetical protein
MSIAKRQAEIIIDQTIREELCKGNVPTVEGIALRMSQILGGRSFGSPMVKYRPAVSRSRSDSEAWNNTIDEINNDLQVVYAETRDQMERILNDFDYFEVEKRKLERKIGELSDRIDELLLLNNNADGYLYSGHEAFRTLDGIDTAETSAWIDLTQHEVTLPHAKTGNVKVDIYGQSIIGELISTENLVSCVELERLYNVLDDSVNTSWIQKVILSKAGEISYKVTLKLSGEEVNRLVINPHVTGDTLFTIRYTEDNLNWMYLGSVIAQETIAFNFTSAWLKGLEITVSKSAYDELVSLNNSTGGFAYYFGLTNISLLKLGYESCGTVTLNPMNIVDRQGNAVEINQLSLGSVSDIPPGCSIEYEVGLEKSDEIYWQPMLPIDSPEDSYPKVIDLKSISSNYPIDGLDASLATHYPDENTVYNGLRFYTITSWDDGNSNHIPVEQILVFDNSMPRLYKGVGQHRRETFIFEPDDGLQHSPISQDIYDTTETITTRYIDIARTIEFDHNDSRKFYRFVTSFYSTSPQHSKTFLLSLIKGSRLQVNIFLNGLQLNDNCAFDEVDGTSQSLEWTIMEGWNVITLLVYKYDVGEAVLDLGVNIKDLSNTVRADQEPMTYIAPFEYFYNTHERETDKYTVSEDNMVVIGEYQKLENAVYSFWYKYSLDSVYSNRVRVRAALKQGDDPGATPRLKYLKVRVS